MARSTKLEASRTNHLTRSEDFSHADWATTGSVTVTSADAVAPDGATTADKVADTDDTATSHIQQTYASYVSGDPVAGTVYIRKRDGAPTAMFLVTFTGNDANQNVNLRINPETGQLTQNNSVDELIDYGVTRFNDDWWRLRIVTRSNSDHDTVLWRVYPARDAPGSFATDGSVQGYQHLWGAQLEDGAFPSSYIATVASAETRSADSASFDISGTGLATPQEMTIYVKFVDRGRGSGDRLFQLGSTDSEHVRLYYSSGGGGGWNLGLDNGTDPFDDSGPSGDPNIGDVVELRGVVEDGALTLGRSVNGGPESTLLDSSTPTLPAGWSDETVYVGRSNTGHTSFADFIALTISSGVKTMSEMRSLADSKSGDLYSYYPGDAVDTFSRASVATYSRPGGVLGTVSSGEIRDAHYVDLPMSITIRLTP